MIDEGLRLEFVRSPILQKGRIEEQVGVAKVLWLWCIMAFFYFFSRARTLPWVPK